MNGDCLRLGAFTVGMLRDFNLAADSSVSEYDQLKLLMRQFGILGDSDDLASYHELQNWARGGSETFVASAEVSIVTKRGVTSRRRFIAKAMVPFGSSADVATKSWLARRDRLSAHIKVPQLFGVCRAVIYEQLLPLSLADSMAESNWTDRNLASRLAAICLALEVCGFRPTDLIGNIWVERHDLYWVDFGEDLGGFQSFPTESLHSKMIAELRSNRKLASEFTVVYNSMKVSAQS